MALTDLGLSNRVTPTRASRGTGGGGLQDLGGGPAQDSMPQEHGALGTPSAPTNTTLGGTGEELPAPPATEPPSDVEQLTAMLGRGETPGFTLSPGAPSIQDQWSNGIQGTRAGAAYEGVYNAMDPAGKLGWLETAGGLDPNKDIYAQWAQMGPEQRKPYEEIYNAQDAPTQKKWRDYADEHSAPQAPATPETTPWGTWDQTPQWAQQAHDIGTNVLPFQSGDAGPRIDTGAQPAGMTNEEYSIWRNQPYQSYAELDALLDPSGMSNPASLGDQPRQSWKWSG